MEKRELGPVEREILRGDQQLDLLIAKPDRILDLRPFKLDLVKTKRLVNRSNTMNGTDRSFEPSEGTIAHHLHTTALWKDMAAHAEYPF
jgi:hypothetical protein